ncbi:hypothetical protein N9978_02040, partial [Akkermansiaceae bacterium]|nr:hypothetical protein [Akkermansiaceae bacterium]
RSSVKGNTMPIVVVCNSDGSKAITGFSAVGNNSDTIKKMARDLKKDLKANPALIAGGAVAEKAPDKEEAAEEAEEQDDVLVESREWTNSKNKNITAAVISVNQLSVTFLMKGNKQVKYPLAKLSPESQAELRKLIK